MQQLRHLESVLHALDQSNRRDHLGRHCVHGSVHLKLGDQHHRVQTMLPHVGAYSMMVRLKAAHQSGVPSVVV
eukprot:2009858-Pleurochrysis_carterae.AAC.1